MVRARAGPAARRAPHGQVLRQRRLRHRRVRRLRPLGDAVEPVRGQARRTGTRPERLVVLVDAVAERDLLAALVGGSSAPAITRSSMSVTSSASRRPFGNPATSPASTPKRFGFAAGGTPRLSFSVSAAAGFLPICVSPGTPVSSAWTMSVRLVSLTPRSNSAFRSRAGSGLSAYLPKFCSVVRRATCG